MITDHSEFTQIYMQIPFYMFIRLMMPRVKMSRADRNPWLAKMMILLWTAMRTPPPLDSSRSFQIILCYAGLLVPMSVRMKM